MTGGTSRPMVARMPLRGAWDVETLVGNVALTRKHGHYQKLDPGGSSRDATLFAQTVQDEGDWFYIANAADAAENLVIKDDAGSTVATVNQSEMAVVYVDAAGAWQLFAILTIALS